MACTILQGHLLEYNIRTKTRDPNWFQELGLLEAQFSISMFHNRDCQHVKVGVVRDDLHVSFFYDHGLGIPRDRQKELRTN